MSPQVPLQRNPWWVMGWLPLGKRPLLCIGKVPPVDVLIWDVAGEARIRACTGNLRVASLDIVANRFFSLRALPLAFWYVLRALFDRRDEGGGFLREGCRSAAGIIRTLAQCLHVSAVLAHRPKVVISYTDDSITTQRIDAILHRHIHVVTVQNGRRWHSACLMDYPEYRMSYIPPGFHSCFAALSRQEIDHHLAAGWKIPEARDIGGLNAALAYDAEIPAGKAYDICIIENSPAGVNRESNRRMADLINHYVRGKGLKVCIALKRNESDRGYPEYYDAVRSMYDQSIVLLPRSTAGSSINVTVSSRLTIGVISTLLIETFGLGHRIYPLNFEHEAFDVGYDCLGLNLRPTRQEFDATVDELLAISDVAYHERYSDQMAYIGTMSLEKRPVERLTRLLLEKVAHPPS